MARTEILVKNLASNHLVGRFWVLDRVLPGHAMNSAQVYALFSSTRPNDTQLSVPYLRLLCVQKSTSRLTPCRLINDHVAGETYYVKYHEHPTAPDFPPLPEPPLPRGGPTPGPRARPVYDEAILAPMYTASMAAIEARYIASIDPALSGTSTASALLAQQQFVENQMRIMNGPPQRFLESRTATQAYGVTLHTDSDDTVPTPF